MFNQAIQLIKTKKSLLQIIVFFIVFMIIYTFIDRNNISYTEMSQTYGNYLIYTNISLNLIMSLLSALLLILSTAMATLKGKETISSNVSFVSVFFGILTYGCTPCVIAFLGSIGIAFSVTILPLAGLPYKIISLVLILIGLVWTYYEIEHGKCKVKKI
ncbi:MAG TPA: hypothetical protein VFH18_07980 [Erysipelotrichaceae bacterium]|nr:hypothetical protein [Erysipelotrichaceae bacterium]